MHKMSDSGRYPGFVQFVGASSNSDEFANAPRRSFFTCWATGCTYLLVAISIVPWYLLYQKSIVSDGVARTGQDPIDVRNVDDVLHALREATHLRADSSASLHKWREAQKAMLERTLPIRAWLTPSNGTCLYKRSNGSCTNKASSPFEWTSPHSTDRGLADEAFFEHFMQRFRTEPNFYLGLVYLPIPWKSVAEDAPRRYHTQVPLKQTVQLLQYLDPDFRYFTVMVQGCAHDFGVDINWSNVLVFDSRGSDRTIPSGGLVNRVPIPLRYMEELPLMPVKSRQVFFAGSCSWNEIRMSLPSLVNVSENASSEYEWLLYECDDKLPYEIFVGHLRNATWAFCVAGTHPVSFVTYQALQVGSLPIIPYDMFSSSCTRHEWSCPSRSEAFIWLPYRDIGVRWLDFAVLLPKSELTNLAHIIDQMKADNVAKRLATVQKYRPLFTPVGLATYIEYILSVAQKSFGLSSVAGPDAYEFGRSTMF
ncbi:unnamed protein product [Prorocentrum cordatum]|uniref:Exostosin GT47 domain-containing protein n=1 Tax=Prorocentrum cordatum TaxID=2364126 RepID=A0ABN9YGN1_9DINO|nr:unnamed protein product [Polarella glacialis]